MTAIHENRMLLYPGFPAALQALSQQPYRNIQSPAPSGSAGWRCGPSSRRGPDHYSDQIMHRIGTGFVLRASGTGSATVVPAKPRVVKRELQNGFQWHCTPARFAKPPLSHLQAAHYTIFLIDRSIDGQLASLEKKPILRHADSSPKCNKVA
jgi:hypothetical protein